MRLAAIARDARENAVLPTRNPALDARSDVVDREVARLEMRAAVLAAVVVPREEILAVERNRALWDAPVAVEYDDFGHGDPVADGPHARLVVRYTEIGPGLEVVERQVRRVYGTGDLLVDEHEGMPRRREVDRNPVPVQDERRLFQDGG
jgi:hypothetical protein